MSGKRLGKILASNPAGLIINLFWVYVCYEVCRLAFLAENWQMFSGGMSWKAFWQITLGGLKFDTSAIFYTNSLVILLYLLPLHVKERKWYWLTTKWIYVIINAVCLFMNLADTVFFEFRKHRTSMAVFDEFKGEGNIGGIVGTEIVSHWYLAVLFVAMVALLWRCYRIPGTPVRPLKRYYITQIVTLVLFVPVTIFGMRGNTFFSATRPIAVSYAHRYVSDPIQTGIVLNTPFSIIRTINQLPKETPVYFTDRAEMLAIYNPVHQPSDSAVVRKKNIVILIVESFAQEFVGSLNRHLDGGTYKGYTPFADELLAQSLYFTSRLPTHISPSTRPLPCSPRFRAWTGRSSHHPTRSTTSTRSPPRHATWATGRHSSTEQTTSRWDSTPSCAR